MSFHIRRIEPGDAGDMARLQSAAAVVRHTSQQPYQTAADWQEKLQQLPAHCHWLVACSAEGDVMASAGLNILQQARCRHVADVFLVVRDEWQGRGVGRALMQALLELADNWLGLVRLQLMAQQDNARAIALYERFGFQHEGVVRQDILQDGQYVDSVVMARLCGPIGVPR
ncbi:MAG: GNAT family N-acetyltransferase [Aquitalea sp.]|nr:GNAT family N-acetyltransferase [Aquitalea sp.]